MNQIRVRKSDFRYYRQERKSRSGGYCSDGWLARKMVEGIIGVSLCGILCVGTYVFKTKQLEREELSRDRSPAEGSFVGLRSAENADAARAMGYRFARDCQTLGWAPLTRSQLANKADVCAYQYAEKKGLSPDQFADEFVKAYVAAYGKDRLGW